MCTELLIHQAYHFSLLSKSCSIVCASNKSEGPFCAALVSCAGSAAPRGNAATPPWPSVFFVWLSAGEPSPVSVSSALDERGHRVPERPESGRPARGQPAAAAFLSNARGILVRMPVPWVRTAMARLRPRGRRRCLPPAHPPLLRMTPLPATRHYLSWGLPRSALSELLPGRYRLAATTDWAPWKITPNASIMAPRY